MIGQLRLHSRSNTKRLVDAAKVVISEMQAKRSPVIFKLFGESHSLAVSYGEPAYEQ